MKYVLDSSVALKWVLLEADSAKAHSLRNQAQNQVHELHAPDILPIEAAHTLVRAERRGVIKQGEGQPLLYALLADCPVLHSYLSLLDRAFGRADRRL